MIQLLSILDGAVFLSIFACFVTCLRPPRQIHVLRETPFAGTWTTALVPRSVKCTLDYLTIIWHSEAEELVVPETLSSFLMALIDLLPRHRFDSWSSSMICEAILTALSVMERCPVLAIGKFAGDCFVYDLAVRPGCTSNVFIAACTFFSILKAKRSPYMFISPLLSGLCPLPHEDEKDR